MSTWTVEKDGNIHYDGKHRISCYVPHDDEKGGLIGYSFTSDHTLAEIVARLLNQFEEAFNPAALEPGATPDHTSPHPSLLRIPIASHAGGGGDLLEWAEALTANDTNEKSGS